MVRFAHNAYRIIISKMADVSLKVLVDLSGSNTLVDISDRVRRVRGRYGRHSGVYNYEAGRCRVELHSDDNFLTPGGGSTHEAELAHGGKCEITAEVGGQTLPIFSGNVDDVLWQGGANSARVVLVVVDSFARLSNARITATLPAEFTGQRAERILRLANFSEPININEGTIYCPEIFSDNETALDLLRTCAVTESGRLDVTHAGSNAGSLEFIQRGPLPALSANITDLANSDGLELLPSAEPITTQDPDLLINRVQFELPEGDFIIAESEESQARYGVRNLEQKVFSGRDDTINLANWWIDLFAQSYFRVRSVSVGAHFESDLGAQVALGVNAGSVVGLSYVPAGGSNRVSTSGIVDGIEFAISPLSPVDNTVQIDLRWSLFPAESSAYWILGDTFSGILGRTTKLSPPITAADITQIRNHPGGRIRWSDADVVTATAYSAGVTSQMVTAYDTNRDRDLCEVYNQLGQASLVANPDVVERLQMSVWTGFRFTPQLQTNFNLPETPQPANPFKPVLTATTEGISSEGDAQPLALSWTYSDPNLSAQTSVQIRRKNYRVEANDPAADSNDPLDLVARVRYRNHPVNSGWGRTPIALDWREQSIIFAQWYVRLARSPVRFSVRVTNAEGLSSAWSDDVVVDTGRAGASPQIAFTNPSSQPAATALNLIWQYTDADLHEQASYSLMRIVNGEALIWDGTDFEAGRPAKVGAETNALIPAGWADVGDNVTFYLFANDASNDVSLPAHINITAT